MKENNIKIYQNPNEEELKEIIEAVEANEGYCPCALTKDDDTKCMCHIFRINDDVDFCHCGRFYKIREYETIALVGDITDDTDVFDWWENTLSKQDFIVIPVKMDSHNIYHHSLGYQNLCRSKIHKADAVFILDDNSEWVLDMEVWSEAIGKRVLNRSELKNET